MMKRNLEYKKSYFFYTIVLLLLVGGKVFAQTELSGSIENQYSLRLNNPYDFTKLNNILSLEMDSVLEENVSAYADLDLKYAFGNKDISGYLFQYPDTENYFSLNLDEIYLTLSTGIFDISVGKQKVSWGTVDALAPTDNINPVDYKEFDIIDFSNMKIAVPMLKVDAYLYSDYLHIEALYIPRFFPNIYPDIYSDWAFYQPPFPETMVIGASTYNVFSDLKPTVYPAKTLGSSEVGFRVGSSVGGYDFSVNYFYTWDDNPTIHQELTLDSPGPGDVTVTTIPKYHRLHIIGLDLARAIGEIGIRAESAFFITEDPRGDDDEIKDPFLKWAIGCDYTFFNNYTINLQFSEVIENFNFNSLEDVEVLNSIIGNLTARFFEETLEAKLSGIYNFEDHDYLIIPQLEYDLSDTLNFSIGAQLFGGEDDTLLGHYDQNDALFVHVTYNF